MWNNLNKKICNKIGFGDGPQILLLYYRKVFRTSYNIKRSTENCFAIFASEQRRGMKSNLKGYKILIMPLLFYFKYYSETTTFSNSG